jgi:MFS family permease
VIISDFPPQERGAAIGSWTAWSGIAFVVGPLAGGWLIDVASWRWIFAVNVPFVLATLGLVAVAVPRSAERRDVHLDSLGALLTVLGLAGPVLALIRQPAAGWASPEVWAVGLGGLALLGLFLGHEARTPHPMLPLELFARRNFAIGNLETFVMYGGMGALFFFLTLFLQQVAGYDALEAGVATIPTTLVMFTFSRRAGRLADRYGPRVFMGGGPLLAAVGLGLLQRVDADLDYWTDLLPALLVFSAGLVCTVAPLTATVLADADEHNAGIASGVNNAIARTGGLLAVAILPAAAGLSGESYADPAAMTSGWQMAMWICAGLCVVGGLVAFGVRNDVLTPAPAAPEESPAPGEAYHCGVAGPPTHLRPARHPASR